jgi:hypothetical protein
MLNQNRTLGGGSVDKDACCAGPTRQPDVVSALDRLEYATNDLCEAVALLGERLIPVLVPEPPSKEGKGQGCPTTARAPLAEAIDDRVERIRRTICLLNELRNRLEI